MILISEHMTPVNYCDPSGRFVDVLIDVVSIFLSAKDMIKDPSLANAGWLALDIVFAVIPFLTASRVIRGVSKVDNYDVFAKYGDDVTKYHKHHTFPKYLGGDPKQKLTKMIDFDHRKLHSGLSKFEGGWLYPKKGYNGKKIQKLYNKDKIVAGLNRYYQQNFPSLLDDFLEVVNQAKKI